MVKVARMVATLAHHGQVDKGGNDYITHPEAVANAVETEDEKVVAWLHDVVEDTYVTLEDLSGVFPPEIVSSVDSLTQRPDEGRDEYLRRVADDPVAIKVKMADLVHNSDISRLNREAEKKDLDRVLRYSQELEWLRSVRDRGRRPGGPACAASYKNSKNA